MTRQAKFTQADLQRAIRAAKSEGTVALQTPAGIAFVDPAFLPQNAPEAGTAVDDWFRNNGTD